MESDVNEPLFITDKERKKIQHNLKIYCEKYFKEHIEKSIAKTSKMGAQKVRESRLMLADDFSEFIEDKINELLGVNVTYHYVEVDAENDFTFIMLILDRKVISSIK